MAAPGEPAVRVVGPRGNVVACVPERFALGLAEGDAARRWIRGQRSEARPGKIVAPGGISDLLFPPDGSLATASTPSTADGDAGAPWRVDRTQAGTLAPRLVQRFPGLKPERIAPSPSPGKPRVVCAPPPVLEEHRSCNSSTYLIE
ncbi:hypothetical protein BE11_24505 [Sorangium cellulosum]|nr:hypothetical protein BE11_24505 [Sorangium cellulosum]